MSPTACLTQAEANTILAMKVLLGREKAAERLGITAALLDHVSRRGPSRVEVVERVRERLAAPEVKR